MYNMSTCPTDIETMHGVGRKLVVLSELIENLLRNSRSLA